MIVGRVARVTAILILFLISLGCGDYYRPVANPVTPTQPNPAFTHDVVVLSVNGTSNPGASTTIDVSGDSAVSQAAVGMMPVSAALVLSATRVYVANSVDNTVSLFSLTAPSPVTTIGLPQVLVSSLAITAATQSGTATTYSYTLTSGTPLQIGMKIIVAGMQSPGNNGLFTITALGTGTFTVTNPGGSTSASQSGTGTVGSMPTFVATTENTTVYVSSAVTDTLSGDVFAIATATGAITNTITVGINPVAMAEIPNGQKLYVANRGGGLNAGSVTSVNTIDKTPNPPILAQSPPNTQAVWVSPIWVASRSDGQRAYVLDQGAGTVSAINTFTDTVVGTASVGVGANYMLYDPILNRLYVTNPVANTLTSLDATSDTLPATPVTIPNAVSVAALPDGTRVYIASAAVSGANVTSSVIVLNASGLTVKTTIPLNSVAVSPACSPKTFSELSIAAAADSSRVYVGNCDAGNTALIQTSTDTLLLNVPAPLSALPPVAGTPPPQNPVFVVAGP